MQSKYNLIFGGYNELEDLNIAVEEYLIINPSFQAIGSPFFISMSEGYCQAVGITSVSGGSLNKTTPSSAGNYQVLSDDYIVSKTGVSPGGDTVTLPLLSAAATGQAFIVSDESGTASEANPIIVDGSGAELIDGEPSISITVPYGFLRLYKNNAGTQWKTF